MSELSLIVKLGALLILGVGALIITYKCAAFIYRTVLDTPPPPQVASKPVPDVENVTPITDAVSLNRRIRNTGT